MRTLWQGRLRLQRVLGIGVILLVVLGQWPRPVTAQEADWDIDGGHFYTQASGGDGTGYSVTDADGVLFWSRFQQFGGVDAVGYPISQRFIQDGFVTQAMQRVVFQWRPDTGQVYFLNVMDLLSQFGRDDQLFSSRQVPGPSATDETGKSWEEVVAGRLSWLEERPAIRSKYFSVAGDPVVYNGLPTSRVADMGNHYALRTQRVVLQEWKEDVPWARAGQVTVALGGAIAREFGLIPGDSVQAESPPPKRVSSPLQSSDSIFAARQVVSLYGYPGVPVLGALGEQGLDATVARAQEMASRVDALNGTLEAQPAFHIIYGLAHPSPVPSHLDDETTERYIAAAEQSGLLVFLDLQIAGSPLESEVARVLPYLRHPNVHLSIDPEFATNSPAESIGSLDGTQINAAQQQVSDYLEQQGIGGRKVLIVHQFRDSMITNKRLLKAYPRIDLVIDGDGVGGKEAKIGNYVQYAAHPTRQYLGFKVFLKHDVPPMTVPEVLALDPQPNVIIYQ